jgi:DNA-binding transcriptional LysR family regulator
MDLELLRTFLEVTRARHFGKAAEVLHLTQAAVSARIRLLEEQLGVTLLVRSRRDTRPTPEGNRLVRHAELLLAEWRKARQDVTAGGAERQLSVGASVRLWDVALTDWLVRLRRLDPELALITQAKASDTLVRGLLDGVLDLAFMLDPPQADIFQTREVTKTKLVLVTDRPRISAAEALGPGFLMVDWGHTHALELARSYPDMPEPKTRLASARTARSCLRELGGAAYLPLRMVATALRNGDLHRVEGAATFRRSIYAVFAMRSGKVELIERVLEIFPSIGKTRRGQKA